MREGWKVDKIGNYVDLQQGFALNKKSDYHISDVPTQYPLLKISDLINNTETLFVKESIPKQFLIHEHELIFSRTGQVGLIFKGKKGVIYNNCFKIIPNELIDSDYIYYYFKQDYVIENVRNLATGAAQPDLNHSAFKSIDISFPESKETQRKIAKILSNYDDLIENNLKRIKILEEMAQQTYEEWFVRMRFPGYETTKINETTGLPEGWERVKLGDLWEIQSSKRIYLSDYVDFGIPFFRGKEITQKSENANISDLLFIKKDKFNDIRKKYGAPRTNDILITAVGTLGNLYMVKETDEDFYFKDGNLIWFKANQLYSSYYLFYYLKSHSFQNYIANIAIGSSQKALTIKGMKESNIVRPKDNLIFSFDKIVIPIFKSIENLQNQNQRLREARNILLPRLMMGLVDVHDIDL